MVLRVDSGGRCVFLDPRRGRLCTIHSRLGPNAMASACRDAGIVRNRLKITSTIDNARGVLDIRAEFGSLDVYLWRFVDGVPLQNKWATLAAIPAKTDLSDTMSKDLKKRGFRFVGSTICYAFMQAVGMVNDHTTDCFRYQEIRQPASASL